MQPQIIHEQIIALILCVKEKITDESDTVWTKFETPLALRNHIDFHLQQLREGNTMSLKEFNLLFAPTGTFQEHAISNDWRKEYMVWSEKFDKLLLQS